MQKKYLSKKYKMSGVSIVGLGSVLILVGILIVNISRADVGTAPLLVSDSLTTTVPNEILYTVTVTNPTDQRIDRVRLNIQLPDFDTRLFGSYSSAHIASTNANAVPAVSMGANSTCSSATNVPSYTNSAWELRGTQDACPHSAWQIPALAAGETRTFSFKANIKGDPEGEFVVTHYSQVRIWGSFVSPVPASGLPLLGGKYTESNRSYATCKNTAAGWVCAQTGAGI